MKTNFILLFIIWSSLSIVIIFGIFLGLNTKLSETNLTEDIKAIERIENLDHAKKVAISSTRLATSEHMFRIALTRVVFLVLFFALSIVLAGWLHMRRIAIRINRS